VYKPDPFITDAPGEGDDDDLARRSLHHTRLDRRERELDDQDLVRIAQDISQRNRRSTAHYTGDMNDIPQRLLMPDVKDANLWQVRCKVCFF
jgi:transcription elongation factor SPT5